jgi:uncharacterized membrane protein
MRKLRRAEPLETARSEFFSDAVFAVAITLLALDLVRIRATPGIGDGTLFAAIGRFWPVLLAFAASFAFIGVAWINHHNIFSRVKLLSRSLNAANLMLLAGVVLIPWVTSTLAEALSIPGKHGQQEVLVYGIVLILNSIAWFILMNVLANHPELLVQPEYALGFATDRFSALLGVGTGAVAGLIGFFWSPIVATAMFLAMPIFYAVVSEGFEPADKDAKSAK